MSDIAAMKTGEPHLRLWTKDEYYKMSGIGLFDGKRVELIEGKVIDMSPMGSLHAVGVTVVYETLARVYGSGYFLRIQLPFDLGEISEPEPDVAVVPGRSRDYIDGHPSHATLIVEVAETSLDYDRTDKASVYAKRSIPEYWIVNVVDRQLEVYRDPAPDPEQPHGYRYRTCQTYKRGDTVSPLEVPQASIAVADLLP